jgi:hypothetical protein
VLALKVRNARGLDLSGRKTSRGGIVSRTNHIARPSGAHAANQQGASGRWPHKADPG